MRDSTLLFPRLEVADDQPASRSIVLLVDDSPESLGQLIEALEGAGLTTLVARDGESALSILSRITPDLVLLDAIMPGLDGFATCNRIKQRPELATTPVVFMTGLSDSAHVLAGLSAGGVDYVTKPINHDELIARIAVHVANARMIATARQALDASGYGVVAFRRDGTVSWASPRAIDLLGATADVLDEPDRAALLDWLAQSTVRPVSRSPDLTLKAGTDANDLRLVLLGRSGFGEILARVTSNAPVTATLSKELGISLREAEVLTWLARGKSNKDIAAILQLSPRTITKHVEQIFTKMGVENRTAAAALALRYMTKY